MKGVVENRVEGAIVEPPAIDLGNFAEQKRPRKRASLVEECLRIDMAELRRFAAFRETDGGRLSWCLGQTEIATAQYVFKRQSADTGELMIELQCRSQRRLARFGLTATLPNFGGHRFWFLCPNCAGRVRTLFIDERELELACRRCHGLQYRSAQTHDARVDELRNDQTKMAAMLFDRSGTVFARLRRLRLVDKAVTAKKRQFAKGSRTRRKGFFSDECS